MAKRKDWRIVCTRCLEESDACWTVPGSDGLDLLVCIISLPVLCIPGLMLAAYRSTRAHWTCDVCGSREIVPTGSRRGRQLLGESRDR